jgi:hypothetical protein
VPLLVVGAKVPDDLRFKTKPQLAVDILTDLRAAGLLALRCDLGSQSSVRGRRSPSACSQRCVVSRVDYYDDPQAPAANSLVPAVSAVVVDDAGRLLLHCRQDNGLWVLPGGGLEVGESVGEAVVREVAEETGYQVEPMYVVGSTPTRNISSRTTMARFVRSSVCVSLPV